jgi:hypothetical protein
MINSKKVKEIIQSLDINTLQTTLEPTLQNQNFDFETKIEWSNNKGTVYVEETSNNGSVAKINVIEFKLN